MKRAIALALLLSLAGVAAVPAEDKPGKAGDSGKGVSERPAALSGELAGELLVREPVPLDGPAPAVLNTAKVGDRVLLQVGYAPHGSVVPKKVTVRVDGPALTALDVISSGRPLQMPKAGEKAEGKDVPCFAVLLRANAAGGCNVVLTCEMSDGSQKKVPFEFKVSK